MLQRTYTQMPLKEISKISCTCRECKTEILVDMNENADREEAIQELEKACPICGQNFAAGAEDTIVTLEGSQES